MRHIGRSAPDGRMQDANYAAEVVRKDGCTLVTEWVKNHWSWIVWKLTNTVYLWPGREGSQWAFDDVLKQLKYRYVRLAVTMNDRT